MHLKYFTPIKRKVYFCIFLPSKNEFIALTEWKSCTSSIEIFHGIISSNITLRNAEVRIGPHDVRKSQERAWGTTAKYSIADKHGRKPISKYMAMNLEDSFFFYFIRGNAKSSNICTCT